MSGDVFVVMTWARCPTGIQCVESGKSRNAVKHPATRRKAPHSRELAAPDCQQRWGRETCDAKCTCSHCRKQPVATAQDLVTVVLL